MKFFTLPLVILGVMLSTLHQSSLGTLFVLMPFRLHPLWYSPILPILFIVSAIALGLAMVSAESLFTSWLYNRKPELQLVSELARAAAWVLTLYIVIRIGDLLIRGDLIYLFGGSTAGNKGSWSSFLFVLELLICAIIPSLLFFNRKIRNTLSGLAWGAGLVIVGFILNRIDTSGISTITVTGSDYFPSWMELSISLGVVSAAALAFLFFVENFKVWELSENSEFAKPHIPAKDPISGVWLSRPWASPAQQYSLIFIFAAALAFMLLPSSAVRGIQPNQTQTYPPRYVEAAMLKISQQNGNYDTPSVYFLSLYKPNEDILASGAKVSRMLLLDANRNGRYVLFDHDRHKERSGTTASINGLEKSCSLCHHINLPLDKASSCYECHRDMYLDTYIFNHDQHQEWLDGNKGCVQCHTDLSLPKVLKNTKSCEECHPDMRVSKKNTFVQSSKPDQLNYAVGYLDAMHGLCIECHKKKEQEEPELAPYLARCATCHGQDTETGFLKEAINQKVSSYANKQKNKDSEKLLMKIK